MRVERHEIVITFSDALLQLLADLDGPLAVSA